MTTQEQDPVDTQTLTQMCAKGHLEPLYISVMAALW